MMIRILVLALLAAAAWPQEALTAARIRLGQGAHAFSNADYPLAEALFAQAAELDPEMVEARLYLGYAVMMQFIPGEASQENAERGSRAAELFQEVLDREPDNELAATLLASLHFNTKEFDKASAAHKRVVEINPMKAESYYTLGVIAWTRSYEPRLKMRADLGMKPDDTGPLPITLRREELKARLEPILEEGLKHLGLAVEINPQYADAMAYLNLLERELADFADTPAEYENHLARADEWVQRSLDVRRARQP